MLAERLASLTGLTITLFIAAATVHPADAGERFTYERTNRKDGSFTAKFVTVLPLPWEAKLGVDLGGGSGPFATYESAARQARSDDVPPSAAWSSLVVPGFGWVWNKASLNARFDVEEEKFRIGGNVERRLALADGLEAVLQNEYSVAQTGTDADLERSWATSRSIRLNVPATGTAFIARNGFASTDEHWHTALGAEQRISGSMNLVGSINDLESDEPDASIRLNLRHRW